MVCLINSDFLVTPLVAAMAQVGVQVMDLQQRHNQAVGVVACGYKQPARR